MAFSSGKCGQQAREHGDIAEDVGKGERVGKTNSIGKEEGKAGGANFAELIGGLSRKRQEVIRPVLEEPREFVLLKVRDMAVRLGSDPATIVRIVRGMGFGRYREFQYFLHELSSAQATSFDLMRSSAARDSSIPSCVRACLDQEERNLQALRNSLDYKRMGRLARRMHEARQVVVIGGDLAAFLTGYFHYHLTILGFTVATATTPGITAHVTRLLRRRDLVFAISFRRGLRQTVEGMRQAKSQGAYCVGITDTFLSPIARYADESFLASVETTNFGASYVAPMALLNAILVAAANYRRARTLALLRKADTEQRMGFRWYPA